MSQILDVLMPTEDSKPGSSVVGDVIRDRKREIQQELREYITTQTHCDCDLADLDVKLVHYEGGPWEQEAQSHWDADRRKWVETPGFRMRAIDEYRVVVRCEKHNTQAGQALVLAGKLQMGRKRH